jgi:hypothetical protein
MRFGRFKKGGLISEKDSVSGTPTAAVETTALPLKSLMIGAPTLGARIGLTLRRRALNFRAANYAQAH